jgi:membrane protein
VSRRPHLSTATRLTLAAFRRHNASRFGAALAFYVIFSIAPVLLIAIAILGRLFGRNQTQQAILLRLSDSVGPAAAAAMTAMIHDAAPMRTGGMAAGIAVLSLYFGLSGVYRQIDDALQTIWHESPRKKLASMLLVFASGVVLLLSVVADAAIAVTGRYAATRLVGGEWLWHVVQLLVSAVVLTMLFAAVFRHLTPARVEWRNVLPGAAATSVLFVLGKFVLGFYLGKAAVGSAFGAAGSIVVVLLLGVLDGADLLFRTGVHACIRGRARGQNAFMTRFPRNGHSPGLIVIPSRSNRTRSRRTPGMRNSVADSGCSATRCFSGR